MENRLVDLTNWACAELADLLEMPGLEIALGDLGGDASFRRYFRVEAGDQSFIVVDAPPQTEDNETFVRIAGLLRKAGVITPQVYRADFERGFMLLEDFGDTLYLEVLQTKYDAPDEVDRLYKLAIDSLVVMQKNVSTRGFPDYDRDLLHREMQLFEDWFCVKYLDLTLSSAEKQLIADCLEFLENQALSQPRVVVHRDYHSRNLMIPSGSRYPDNYLPAVIDFQDAVTGPYTYDMVSLLRDCYISWPLPYVQSLGLYYRDRAEEQGVITAIDQARFFRDFDLMGLQRNLKVMGIFARLCIRDNKPAYLADIPQTIRYFTDVAAEYEELASFLVWFKKTVLPKAIDKLPAG